MLRMPDPENSTALLNAALRNRGVVEEFYVRALVELQDG